MDLIEWLFEFKNPGPVGTVDQEEINTRESGGKLLVKGVIALFILAIGIYFLSIASWLSAPVWVRVILICVYLFIAARVKVSPDYSNLGQQNTFIDHPFRYTDNQNRFLLALQILLFPGKLLILPVIRLIRYGTTKLRK